MQTRAKLALITACGIAVCAYAPFAAGEPKNQPPFTRRATTSTLQHASRGVVGVAHTRGEPKNEWPFTRRVNN